MCSTTPEIPICADIGSAPSGITVHRNVTVARPTSTCVGGPTSGFAVAPAPAVLHRVHRKEGDYGGQRMYHTIERVWTRCESAAAKAITSFPIAETTSTYTQTPSRTPILHIRTTEVASQPLTLVCVIVAITPPLFHVEPLTQKRRTYVARDTLKFAPRKERHHVSIHDRHFRQVECHDVAGERFPTTSGCPQRESVPTREVRGACRWRRAQSGRSFVRSRQHRLVRPPERLSDCGWRGLQTERRSQVAKTQARRIYGRCGVS